MPDSMRNALMNYTACLFPDIKAKNVLLGEESVADKLSSDSQKFWIACTALMDFNAF